MIRFLFSISSFLVLFVLETSFLHALPTILPLIPLVFAVSLFLIQSFGLIDGVLWMFGYGLLLDLSHLSPVPFFSVILGITGLIAFVLARRVFSNRSLYGTVIFALCASLSFIMLENAVRLFLTFTKGLSIQWSLVFQGHLIQTILLLLMMSFLFQSTKR